MKVARWVPVAVLAVLLAGCGGGSGSPSGASESPSGASSVGTSAPTSGDSPAPAEDSSRPPVEGTGTEKPQERKDDGPYISSASLPIGGDTIEDFDGVPQCADATWLGDEIPAGVSLHVESTDVAPGAFAVGGAGCAGRGPACAGFTFTLDERKCEVPLTRTGQHLDEDAVLSLHGTATCPRERPDFCRRLATADAGTIALIAHALAPTPPDPSRSTGTTDSTGTTGSAATTGTTGTTGATGWRR